MGRERHPIPCVGSGNDPWAFSSTESWPKPGTGSMKPVKPWRNLAFEIITGIEDCNPSFGVEHGSSFEEMESVGMWQPKHGDTTATQLVVILGQTERIYWFTVSEVRLPLHVVELRPTMQHVSHFAFHSSKNKYWQHVLLFCFRLSNGIIRNPSPTKVLWLDPWLLEVCRVMPMRHHLGSVCACRCLQHLDLWWRGWRIDLTVDA